MHNAAIAGALAVYGSAVWRLRGGAFAALSGINIGTPATRAACGFLLALPLAALVRDPRALLLWPALFAGLSCVGWGPFQGLQAGTAAGAQRDGPYVWAVDRLGFEPSSPWWSIVGLMICAAVCFAPAAAVAWWLDPRGWWVLAAMVPWFPPAYWLGSLLPTLGSGPRWRNVFTAWGEALVGAALAPCLWLALGGPWT